MEPVLVAKNLSKTEILNKEGSKMLSKIKKQDYVILLDVKGNSMNSVEFSRFIDHKMVNSYDSLVFLICGAFGCSNSIYLNHMLHIFSLYFCKMCWSIISSVINQNIYFRLIINNLFY